MVRKWLLLLAPVLASCSKGPQADLQYIGDARSLAAEWALINDRASQGKLTDIYVGSMHQWLRQQLQADSASLTEPNSPYGDEIATLLRQPDDAAPTALNAHADRLKQIEDALESA
jgi:hypothetical protein